MKKIILATLVLGSTFLFAFSDKKEDAVTTAVNKLRDALVSGNKADLESIASEKLSYGHSNGLIENKAAFVENIVSGKSDFVSIVLSEQSIVFSGKTAIVRQKLDAVTSDGGKPGEAHLKVLLVWQKQGVSWKLIARQAVKQLQ
jgi:hypothetical protein